MFGCDKPTEKPAYWLVCYNCLGKGCSLCRAAFLKHGGQKGRLPYFQCPRALQLPGDDEAIRAMKYRQEGEWPVAGGWRDQANFLVELLSHLGGVWNHFQKKSHA